MHHHLFTLGILFSFSSILWADTKPTRLELNDQSIDSFLRSDFYGVYLANQKIGWGKIGLVRSTDPKQPGFVSLMEMKMKLKTLGRTSEMDISQNIEFDAKAPYAFRGAVTRESDGTSEKVTRITRTAKGLDVTIQEDQETTKKQIAPVDYTLLDLLTPQIWIRKSPKKGDKITVTDFDTDELKLESQILTLKETKTTTADGVKITYHDVEMHMVQQKITGIMRYDDKAEKLLTMQLAGAFEFRMEPEKLAKNASIAIDLFELGKVKIDQKLGQEATITSLIVEAKGKQELQLPVGLYQSTKKTDSGSLQILLGKEHGKPIKATPEETKENLEETSEYPIRNPKVQALTKEAIGDAKTPEEKVKRLLAFVHDYITPSHTAQPLTLTELLKNRKGDCSEYALLFNVLARAAGIPTRQVVGLVYMGDDQKAFGLHAWNEVLLDGQWLPVDASSNEFHLNPTHICFGTQIGDQMTNIAVAMNKLSFTLVEVKRK